MDYGYVRKDLMTYGVPYSFVPGTKAKADEVNANFIDVLDKIKTTNERIDETNSTAQSNKTTLEEKINTDVSNLNSNIQTALSKKVDTSKIDGNWVKNHSILANGRSIAKGATHNFSLSSYLPSGGIYEVIVGVNAQTASVAGTFVYLLLSSDFLKDKIPVLKTYTNHASMAHAAGTQTIVVGTSRTLSIYNSTSTASDSAYGLEVFAYRKVR